MTIPFFTFDELYDLASDARDAVDRIEKTIDSLEKAIRNLDDADDLLRGSNHRTDESIVCEIASDKLSAFLLAQKAKLSAAEDAQEAASKVLRNAEKHPEFDDEDEPTRFTANGDLYIPVPEEAVAL
jgi:hypothetical protein